jgi:hypothetical protein
MLSTPSSAHLGAIAAYLPTRSATLCLCR